MHVAANPVKEISEHGSQEIRKDSSAYDDFHSPKEMAQLENMEDSDESTGAMGGSPNSINRELSLPPVFEGVSESVYTSTPLHQLRTMEMARKKRHDVFGHKGPIIICMARKSVPCPGSLKKIEFSVD
ncbi:hypothetical protein RHMOL_Rhmol06G0164100 [Rhododendron molle]|uniref:Uncharacterized protein n=1 Tax=Rhododendron molle TaxID=49168 RepID=A0ACC0NCV3_RHOML|nr:hypothetical protein RHMOL_Rhmol06G0164100 [Rhododendron molle]